MTLRVSGTTFLVLLLLLLPSSFIRNADAQVSATLPFSTVPPNVDGTIAAGEYVGSYSDFATRMDVYWQHDGSSMWIGLVSRGTGWVSIGFGPEGTGMDGANIIIGYVADSSGQVVLTDQIGVGFDHFLDVDRGGSDDIVQKAGTQPGSQTILEFVYPLSTSDPNDSPLRPGSAYGFMLAYESSSDDPVTIHTAHSVPLTFLLEAAGGAPPPPTKNTILSVGVPQQIVFQGDGIRVHATLEDENGDPVASAVVLAMVNSTFGPTRAGEDLTDENGTAIIRLFRETKGINVLDVRFSGNSLYKKSSAFIILLGSEEEEGHGIAGPHLIVSIFYPNVQAPGHMHDVETVFVDGKEEYLVRILPSDGEFVLAHEHVVVLLNKAGSPEEGLLIAFLLIGVIVGSVWATFAYTGLQLFRILRERKRNGVK